MDLLLHRFNNIDYIMLLDWTDGISLINKAIEERNKQKIWDMWISVYPNMTKDNYVSFDEFYNKATRKVVISTRSDEEIFNEAIEIQKKIAKKKKQEALK